MSEHYWLHALGVDVMLRRRDDGMYVHLDTSDMDPWYGPLLVEVNNKGATTYGEPECHEPMQAHHG